MNVRNQFFKNLYQKINETKFKELQNNFLVQSLTKKKDFFKGG